MTTFNMITHDIGAKLGESIFIFCLKAVLLNYLNFGEKENSLKDMKHKIAGYQRAFSGLIDYSTCINIDIKINGHST